MFTGAPRAGTLINPSARAPARVGNGLGGPAPVHQAGLMPPTGMAPHVPSLTPGVARGAAPAGQMGLRAQDSLGLIKQRILSSALKGGTPGGHPIAAPTFPGVKVPGMVR
jgi:hypothetical protein